MEVTIVIPTYKRLGYLSQAIESVVQQTHKNWNCIVVNDYPEDREAIANIITDFNDPRLLLINHEVSLGGNCARNTGIKQAQGKVIAFLDDDDLWLPEKLEKHLARHQANPQVGLVFSGVTQVWEEVELSPKTTLGKLKNSHVIEAMSQGNFCPHSTSCVTVLRECFTKCGMFDEHLVSFQDWDMWFRIAQIYPFDSISEALIIFRQHLGDRTSRSIQRRLQGLEQIITKWESQLSNAPQFRESFTKEVYINQINNAILQRDRRKAFSYWQKFFQMANHKQDFLQAAKLALFFVFGLNVYKPLLQGFRAWKLNHKLE